MSATVFRKSMLFSTYLHNADAEKMAALEREERQIKEENIRLQRRLLLEQERRENLGRQLSESESSLEMEDERYDKVNFVLK